MSVDFNFNYDNQTESPEGIAIGNFTDLPIIQREVKILLGYGLDNCIEATINSVNDLKMAIYDAVAVCENKRLLELNEKQKLYTLTEEENQYKENQIKLGKKFHQIQWSKETNQKLQNWGKIEKEKRNRPNFQIVLNRGKHDRVFIHSPTFSKTGNWYWNGWADPIHEINIESLYKCILETEEHCRQINCFINGICENL